MQRKRSVVQRAYVFVKQPQAAILIDPNNRLAGVRVWVSLKNSGTTPAPTMRALTAATFVERESDFKFEHPQEVTEYPLVLGPDSEVAGGYIDIGPQHVIAVMNNQGHQFLSGTIRHHDAFADTPEHIVEFCLRSFMKVKYPPAL